MITEISISHFLIGKSQNSRIKVLLVARFKSVTLSIHVNQCSCFFYTHQLCVILHVKMVLALQMTLATVLMDTKEKDVLTKVSLLLLWFNK